jgi:hypothetical protein
MWKQCETPRCSLCGWWGHPKADCKNRAFQSYQLRANPYRPAPTSFFSGTSRDQHSTAAPACGSSSLEFSAPKSRWKNPHVAGPSSRAAAGLPHLSTGSKSGPAPSKTIRNTQLQEARNGAEQVALQIEAESSRAPVIGSPPDAQAAGHQTRSASGPDQATLLVPKIEPRDGTASTNVKNTDADGIPIGPEPDKARASIFGQVTAEAPGGQLLPVAGPRDALEGPAVVAPDPPRPPQPTAVPNPPTASTSQHPAAEVPAPVDNSICGYCQEHFNEPHAPGFYEVRAFLRRDSADDNAGLPAQSLRMQESTLVPDVLHSRTQAVHSGDVPWRRPVAFVATLLRCQLLGLRLLGAHAGRLPQSGLWQRLLQAVGPFGRRDDASAVGWRTSNRDTGRPPSCGSMASRDLQHGTSSTGT